MKRFRDKVCIVTGGASGIGRELGSQLVRHGAIVTLADLDATRAEEAAASMGAGSRAKAARLNVTDPEAVRELVEATTAEHGRLDYLFNNAGIAIAAEAEDHSLDDWNRVLNVNLMGVVHGVHAAYPIMIRQGHGHIVNTASLAGLFPMSNEIAYVAAKYAVVGLSTALRAEGAAHGVKVSVVCPGFVDTPILYENITIKNPGGLAVGSREEVKALFPVHAMPVEKAAREILSGVARNKAIIPVTRHAKLLWWLSRLSPSLAVPGSWLRLGFECPMQSILPFSTGRTKRSPKRSAPDAAPTRRAPARVRAAQGPFPLRASIPVHAPPSQPGEPSDLQAMRGPSGPPGLGEVQLPARWWTVSLSPAPGGA